MRCLVLKVLILAIFCSVIGVSNAHAASTWSVKGKVKEGDSGFYQPVAVRIRGLDGLSDEQLEEVKINVSGIEMGVERMPDGNIYLKGGSQFFFIALMESVLLWSDSNGDGKITKDELKKTLYSVKNTIKAGLEIAGNQIGQIEAKTAPLSLYIGKATNNSLSDASNFQEVLDDHPAIDDNGTSRPRDAKYMFGTDTPIFIEAELPSGLGDLTDCVQVFSESDKTGITLSLREDGTTGKYRNTISGWTSDALYLGKESSSGAKKAIKVTDEEVITIRLLDKDKKTVIANYSVKVDRAEFLIAYNNYDDFRWWRDGYQELTIIKEISQRTYDSLNPFTEMPLDAIKLFGDSECDNTIFEMNEKNADSNDFVMWSGHGTLSLLHDTYSLVFPGKTQFPLDMKGVTFTPKEDIILGVKDCEWAVFNTCRFMNTATEAEDGINSDDVKEDDIKNRLKILHRNGLHISMGWKTKMSMAHKEMGEYFVEQLSDGLSFIDAWKLTTEEFVLQDSGKVTIGRAFAATDCTGDSLKAKFDSKLSPVEVSRDPLPNDDFTLYKFNPITTK